MPTQPTFTQVRISLFQKNSLLAVASVRVLDAVYLTGLRVIEGKNGLFVTMPNRKTGGGEYQDIYFPADKAMRDELQDTVLEAYRREIEIPEIELPKYNGLSLKDKNHEREPKT